MQPFVGGRMRGVCCSVWRYGLSVSRGADVPDAADFGDSVCGPGRPIGDMDNREKQTVINEALGEFLHVMMCNGKDTKMKCGVKILLRNFFAYRSCMNSGSTSTAAASNIGSSTNRRFTVVPRTETRLPS